jgi:hypothetical protein
VVRQGGTPRYNDPHSAPQLGPDCSEGKPVNNRKPQQADLEAKLLDLEAQPEDCSLQKRR